MTTDTQRENKKKEISQSQLLLYKQVKSDNALNRCKESKQRRVALKKWSRNASRTQRRESKSERERESHQCYLRF